MRLMLIPLLVLGSVSLAQSPSKPVSFKDDIYPLLERRCFECHQGKDAEAGYRLDLRAEILGQINVRQVFIRAHSVQSVFDKRIPVPDKTHLPPRGNERLPDNDIAQLRAWIDHGRIAGNGQRLAIGLAEDFFAQVEAISGLGVLA